MTTKEFFDTTALRSRIKSQFGTLKAFSEKVTMSYACVSSRLSNKTDFTCGEIQEWAKVLGLTGEEIEKYFFHVCCHIS